MIRWCVLGVAIAQVAACGKSDTQPGSAQTLPVTTLQVQTKLLPLTIETVGRAEGSKEVELRARVSGILQKQVYSEGIRVKAGAILFAIDPAPFEIALEQARAALAEERARNQQARRNAERLQELLTKNLVSRNDVDAAVSTLEASDAAILSAQSKVREAELNLSYTNVTAPISGIAGRALRSEGSLVTANTDSSLLTTVTQTNPIWARFALSAAEFDALRAATKSTKDGALTVELLHSDGSAHPQKGRVNFSGSTVDEKLGTVEVRAEFPNPDLSVLPGEYVRVRLSGGAQPTVTVPQTAVLQGAQGPYVWIANAQNHAEQRFVKTGGWVGEDWRINSGLSDGDRVILDNLQKLRPGLVIAIQPVQAISGAVEQAQVSSAKTGQAPRAE